MIHGICKLNYRAVPRTPREVPMLDPVLKRHLLAMVTTLLAAVGLGMISYAMLEGIL